jgi:hypothetical protein
MSIAESYALTTMTVSPEYYIEFRHWLKRHGWLLVSYDHLNNYLLFGSIKPLYAGRQVEAIFNAPYRAGVKFTGYNVIG